LGLSKVEDESDESASGGQLRHARHYVSALKKGDAFYIEGGLAIDDGLSLFDLEQPNIEQEQAWAQSNLKRDPEAALLCLQYGLEARGRLSTAAWIWLMFDLVNR
jgi:hypothetical protein